MIQTLRTNFFDLVIDTNNKDGLLYKWIGSDSCKLSVNDSDYLHAGNLGITGFEHKLLHEITHHYVGTAFGFPFCHIAFAQVHNLMMPPRAGFYEEVIFSMVYLCMEKKMLHDNWWGYLDRLYLYRDVFEIKRDILHVFKQIEYNRIIKSRKIIKI